MATHRFYLISTLANVFLRCMINLLKKMQKFLVEMLNRLSNFLTQIIGRYDGLEEER